MHGNRAPLAIVASLLICASSSATTLHEDFSGFLRRFITEPRFRSMRTTYPLIARLGSQCEEEHRTERWNRVAVSKHLTVPLSHAALAKEGLSEQLTKISGTEVQLLQFRDEAD